MPFVVTRVNVPLDGEEEVRRLLALLIDAREASIRIVAGGWFAEGAR